MCVRELPWYFTGIIKIKMLLVSHKSNKIHDCINIDADIQNE